MKLMEETKYILFVCVHNSARSQMAEGFFNHYNRIPGIVGASAGTSPAKRVHPLAVESMRERGIDISHHKPKPLTPELVEKSWKIFTMGCITDCPITPPEKTIDWNFDDPSGGTLDKFRRVRDEIEIAIKRLIGEIEKELLAGETAP